MTVCAPARGAPRCAKRSCALLASQREHELQQLLCAAKSVDASFRLKLFYSPEELVEVALAKAPAAAWLLLAVVRRAADALDNLEEERRSVSDWLREDLKENTLVVTVCKDAQFLAERNLRVRERVGSDASPEVFVVCLTRPLHELEAAARCEGFAHSLYGGEDIVGLESDVLHPRTAMLLEVGLDLGLALAPRCGLVHREQHELVVAREDHGVEARVDGAHVCRGELCKFVKAGGSHDVVYGWQKFTHVAHDVVDAVKAVAGNALRLARCVPGEEARGGVKHFRTSRHEAQDRIPVRVEKHLAHDDAVP
mmetsp:Transcript_3937/g.11405  ORF Transcript_3937/g.11405 Transcript_3937/m.11405 type:complete len:310 (+) Transcript_3937:135-1064(+)